MKRPDWIICSQEKEVLARFGGRVVWVNRCLRCGEELAVYEGPLDKAISESKKFIEVHRNCEEVCGEGDRVG